MKPWYRNSTLQMDDAEMEWLQKQHPGACAVWEWYKADCQKRETNKVRDLSKIELETVAARLGIDSPKFSQISQNLQSLGWLSQGEIRGWSKWQGGRTPEEDAARKREAYWKTQVADLQTHIDKLTRLIDTPPKISQILPEPPLEERRGDKSTEVHVHAREPDLKPPQTPEEPAAGVVMTLRREISKHYRRHPDARWDYGDEHALLEVCKREGFMSEWTEIHNYSKRNPEFFPRHVRTLLQNWTGTLDCARRPVTEPSKPTTQIWKRIQILQDKIEKHPANGQSRFHNPKATETQKEELLKIRTELKDLKAKEAGDARP